MLQPVYKNLAVLEALMEKQDHHTGAHVSQTDERYNSVHCAFNKYTGFPLFETGISMWFTIYCLLVLAVVVSNHSVRHLFCLPNDCDRRHMLRPMTSPQCGCRLWWLWLCGSCGSERNSVSHAFPTLDVFNSFWLVLIWVGWVCSTGSSLIKVCEVKWCEASLDLISTLLLCCVM